MGLKIYKNFKNVVLFFSDYHKAVQFFLGFRIQMAQNETLIDFYLLIVRSIDDSKSNM